jgi:hypothetical protein
MCKNRSVEIKRGDTEFKIAFDRIKFIEFKRRNEGSPQGTDSTIVTLRGGEVIKGRSARGTGYVLG